MGQGVSPKGVSQREESQHCRLSDSTLAISKWGMEKSLRQRHETGLERKEGHQGRINSEKIINSFLIEMFELCKVLEYAKF